MLASNRQTRNPKKNQQKTTNDQTETPNERAPVRGGEPVERGTGIRHGEQEGRGVFVHKFLVCTSIRVRRENVLERARCTSYWTAA
jgi:hypothetical protein